MVSSRILLIFGVGMLAAAQAQDYCSKTLCSGGGHIACKHNNKFATTCPKDATMINLKPHIPTILDGHNSRRNTIAGGSLPGYKAATRMATMQWDDELAKLAALNVRQCTMKHDSCRNTNAFKYSGQNLAYMWYTGNKNGKSDVSIIKNNIEMWWNEYKVCKMAYIDKYPSSYSGPAIGHFTVFVSDRNIRVGCGAARYTRSNQNHFLMACNYATTNIIGRRMYTSGAAASGCKKGKNPNYKNLCATTEVYDVNNI